MGDARESSALRPGRAALVTTALRRRVDMIGLLVLVEIVPRWVAFGLASAVLIQPAKRIVEGLIRTARE